MTHTHLPPLTDTQCRVFEFIRDHNARTRTGAGFRQICQAFGFASPNAAYGHCLSLRKKGWITFESNRANTIIPTLESLEASDDEA
jgi:SOS-response transcriptional repressor LexA